MSSRTANTPARNPTTFSPRTQEFPLNQQALTALENLKKHDVAQQSATLKESLDRAAKLLADTVGQINDRASEERERRQTRLQRLRRDGQNETDQDCEDFKEYQAKVHELTTMMDEGVRTVVDDQQFLMQNPQSIQHVITKSMELHQGSETDGEVVNNQQSQRLDPSQNCTALLHAARSTADTEWNAQTLTQRYARNNTYADFYRMVWDSKNPGEHPPPLPDPSMWFAAEEGRNIGRGSQRATQRSTEDRAEAVDDTLPDAYDEDTEIQMTSDVRSVKCPLTMRYFEEPMTSTLCPHSFEKSAIISFIHGSETRLPLTAEQENDLNKRYPRSSKGRPQAEMIARGRNPKCAQCPVPGCAIKTLTETDLRFDNVLLRMTKRAQEAERREQEEDGNDPEELDDEDSDDDLLGATQRRKKRKVYAIGSSPMGTENRRRTLIKPERQISVVPNSQTQARSQTLSQTSQGRGRGRGGFIVNDEDEDEDEDADMEG